MGRSDNCKHKNKWGWPYPKKEQKEIQVISDMKYIQKLFLLLVCCYFYFIKIL